ncbi:MAG: 50S ribosomal protein L6 [Thermoplasmatota archaeon]
MTRVPVLSEEVPVPKGLTVQLSGSTLRVKGSRGTVERRFFHPKLVIAHSSGKIRVEARSASRRERALVGTWAAHVRNMLRGVERPFVYTMKAVYAHFPIKMSVKGGELLVENFLGERHPRRAKILGETRVTVRGQELVLEGPDLEEVSQTAANIEMATRVGDRDPRVFQDGIFITSKGED